jgi:GT2 family glycosyltransferase
MKSNHQGPPLVYIVMANFNGYQATSGAIRSLVNLTYPNFKILVVDDCSKDDSGFQLEKDFPEISVIFAKRNGGLCCSYNLGAKEALKNGADYVFQVQNDTLGYSPNFLEKIIEEFNNNPKVGMVGSTIYDSHGGVRWNGCYKEKFGVQMNISEGLVIKKELYEKVGFFNERLVVYFEDIDYIIRLRNAGFETSSATSVSFVHTGQATFGREKFKPNYLRVRNVFLFMKQYCRRQTTKWKLRTINENLRVHLNKMIPLIKRGDLRSFFRVGAAIFFGIIVGLLLPWKEETDRF